MTSSQFLPVRAAAAAHELGSSMRGRVLLAGDRTYDDARRLWNGAVDRHPAVIARCETLEDISAAVLAARDHGLPVSVRGGGHDWNGLALRESGLVVDLSAMRRVQVDAGAGVADTQGGATAGDLDAATHPHGLAPVTGTVKAVGMAGLTMSGGYGLLNGRYGLALDNLVQATVVPADGVPMTASATENPDLFWALRGGGGNFGVVSDLRYRVHPVHTVLAGLLLFPLTAARIVLRRYRELLATAPDELTMMAGFFSGPDGPVLFILPTFSGEPSRFAGILEQLRLLGTPLSDQVAPLPFHDLLGLFDGAVVDGRRIEMRTRWLTELSDDAITILVASMSQVTSPFSAIYLHHFHGAASRVPVAGTAFGLRQDHLLVELATAWEPEASGDERHQRWARETSRLLAPQSLPGGYPNFLGTDEPERVLPAYGPNAERLLDLKRRYDPDHVFTAVPPLPARPTD